MERMKIINVPIEKIIPYKNNPRQNDGAVPFVVESIREYGFRVPLLVDRDMVVIAGHTRLKAAKELGLEELPCIIADDLTPAQVKAYRLMDNKAAEKSRWNEELLAQEFQTLMDEGFDLTKTAFETFEIESITGGLFDDEDGDPEPEEAPEAEAPAEPGTGSADVDDRFSVIICCRTDEEQAAIRKILGVEGDKRQMYTLAEILEMREAEEHGA